MRAFRVALQCPGVLREISDIALRLQFPVSGEGCSFWIKAIIKKTAGPVRGPAVQRFAICSSFSAEALLVFHNLFLHALRKLVAYRGHVAVEVVQLSFKSGRINLEQFGEVFGRDFQS